MKKKPLKPYRTLEERIIDDVIRLQTNALSDWILKDAYKKGYLNDRSTNKQLKEVLDKHYSSLI